MSECWGYFGVIYGFWGYLRVIWGVAVPPDVSCLATLVQMEIVCGCRVYIHPSVGGPYICFGDYWICGVAVFVFVNIGVTGVDISALAQPRLGPGSVQARPWLGPGSVTARRWVSSILTLARPWPWLGPRSALARPRLGPGTVLARPQLSPGSAPAWFWLR